MLVWCDSFDHFATSDISRWYSQSSPSGQAIGATGRRSSNALRFTTTTSISRPVPSLSTYIAGVAYQISALPASSQEIMEFREASTVHVRLSILADGSLTISRNATVVGTSAAGVIAAGSFHFIEVKAVIANSPSGAYEVRVNGVNVLSDASEDTQNGGTGVITNVLIQGAASRNVDIDDFYILDTTGSYNDNFLGDIRVDHYAPNGNGNSSQLLGSDADSTDNYLLVDDATPDDDSTYVESSTSGQKDTYTIANMAHTPATIHGVCVKAVAKKDDAGSRSITTVIRSGGSDTDGATAGLTTSYLGYSDMHNKNPNGSIAWTKSAVDAVEAGVKVAA